MAGLRLIAVSLASDVAATHSSTLQWFLSKYMANQPGDVRFYHGRGNRDIASRKPGDVRFYRIEDRWRSRTEKFRWEMLGFTTVVMIEISLIGFLCAMPVRSDDLVVCVLPVRSGDLCAACTIRRSVCMPVRSGDLVCVPPVRSGVLCVPLYACLWDQAT